MSKVMILTKYYNKGDKAVKAELENAIIYFSYDTVIAVYDKKLETLTITENIWGQTTGRHLNVIDKDITKRVPYSVLKEKLKDLGYENIRK